MTTIIGVRFRKSGKVYYFGPAGFHIKKGDHVIVETIRGIEYGLVVLAPKEVEDNKIVSPLKDVIRIATAEDDKTNAENQKKEKDAFTICLEKIKNHGLEMKLIDSEYTFDKNKLLFYFTADGRIDFRELVKDLASVFRTRIELRQIGVRDETKMIGGIGICGRPLCCHTFLSDFAPVSIKMAKEQNLSLNPTKISGVCGRLMCCLKNEEEVYEYLNSTLPHVGMKVKTYDGYEGEVQSISVLKQLVKVIISDENDEKEVKEYSVKELQFDTRKNHYDIPVGTTLPDEELSEDAILELEQMEQSDIEEAAEIEETRKPKDTRRKNSGRNHHNSSFYEHSSRSRHSSHNEQRSHSERNSHSEQSSRSERNAHSEQSSRSERNAHSEQNPRSERNSHSEQSSRSERSSRSEQNPRSERNYHSNRNSNNTSAIDKSSRNNNGGQKEQKQENRKSSYKNNSRNSHRNHRNYSKK